MLVLKMLRVCCRYESAPSEITCSEEWKGSKIKKSFKKSHILSVWGDVNWLD